MGLRQRRVLILGMPLWLVLEPQQRVALLGHEVGHFANRDSTRALLVWPALRTFGALTDYTQFRESIMQAGNRRNMTMFEVLFRLVMRLVSTVFLVIHLGLSALGMTDARRAEYLADAASADIAGTDAVIGMQERLLLLPRIANVVGYNCETKRPLEWLALAAHMHEAKADELPVRAQATMWATGLWDSHPPKGLRRRMQQAWPAQEPRLVLSREESASIDRELRDWYAVAHMLMLGSRTFREQRG